MKEYEWTGVVSVWEGRARQQGTVLELTEEEVKAPRPELGGKSLLGVGAVELKSEADARRKAAARAEAKVPEVKPNG